jgi:hypothetical protein
LFENSEFGIYFGFPALCFVLGTVVDLGNTPSKFEVRTGDWPGGMGTLKVKKLKAKS